MSTCLEPQTNVLIESSHPEELTDQSIVEQLFGLADYNGIYDYDDDDDGGGGDDGDDEEEVGGGGDEGEEDDDDDDDIEDIYDDNVSTYESEIDKERFMELEKTLEECDDVIKESNRHLGSLESFKKTVSINCSDSEEENESAKHEELELLRICCDGIPETDDEADKDELNGGQLCLPTENTMDKNDQEKDFTEVTGQEIIPSISDKISELTQLLHFQLAETEETYTRLLGEEAKRQQECYENEAKLDEERYQSFVRLEDEKVQCQLAKKESKEKEVAMLKWEENHEIQVEKDLENQKLQIETVEELMEQQIKTAKILFLFKQQEEKKYQLRSAVKIQSTFRMFRTRNAYLTILEKKREAEEERRKKEEEERMKKEEEEERKRKEEEEKKKKEDEERKKKEEEEKKKEEEERKRREEEKEKKKEEEERKKKEEEEKKKKEEEERKKKEEEEKKKKESEERKKKEEEEKKKKEEEERKKKEEMKKKKEEDRMKKEEEMKKKKEEERMKKEEEMKKKKDEERMKKEEEMKKKKEEEERMKREEEKKKIEKERKKKKEEEDKKRKEEEAEREREGRRNALRGEQEWKEERGEKIWTEEKSGEFVKGSTKKEAKGEGAKEWGSPERRGEKWEEGMSREEGEVKDKVEGEKVQKSFIRGGEVRGRRDPGPAAPITKTSGHERGTEKEREKKEEGSEKENEERRGREDEEEGRKEEKDHRKEEGLKSKRKDREREIEKEREKKEEGSEKENEERRGREDEEEGGKEERDHRKEEGLKSKRKDREREIEKEREEEDRGREEERERKKEEKERKKEENQRNIKKEDKIPGCNEVGLSTLGSPSESDPKRFPLQNKEVYLDPLPDILNSKRLAWMKNCLDWGKVSKENFVVDENLLSKPKRERRRPPSNKRLPDSLSEEFILSFTKCNLLSQVTSVDLKNLEGFSVTKFGECLNLQFLSINNCQLLALDNLQSCSQLKYINAKGNNIEYVNLKAMKSLQVLDLSDNNLSSIHGLEECDNLLWLNLGGNRITKLGSGLRSLQQLHTLLLGHNQLINTRGLQCGSVSLQTLDLSHNHLENVEEIEKLCLLNSLDVSGNNLVEIPNLKNQVLIQKLNLSDNYLSSLSELSECWFPLLRDLLLSQNRISSLASLGHYLSLKKMDISSNQLLDISCVMEALSPCKHLEQLLVQGNPLVADEPEIRERLFQTFPVLNNLDLNPVSSENSIEKKAHGQGPKVFRSENDFLLLCEKQSRIFENLAKEFEQRIDAIPGINEDKSLAEIFSALLDWCQKTRKAAIECRYAHEYGHTGQSQGSLTTASDKERPNWPTRLDKVEQIERLTQVTSSSEGVGCHASEKGQDYLAKGQDSESHLDHSGHDPHPPTAGASGCEILQEYASAAIAEMGIEEEEEEEEEEEGKKERKEERKEEEKEGKYKEEEKEEGKEEGEGGEERKEEERKVKERKGKEKKGKEERKEERKEEEKEGKYKEEEEEKEEERKVKERKGKEKKEKEGKEEEKEKEEEEKEEEEEGGEGEEGGGIFHLKHLDFSQQQRLQPKAEKIELEYNQCQGPKVTLRPFEEKRDKKTLAAIKIQSAWRGFNLRSKLQAAIVFAQNVYEEESEFGEEIDLESFDMAEADLEKTWMVSDTPNFPMNFPVLGTPPLFRESSRGWHHPQGSKNGARYCPEEHLVEAPGPRQAWNTPASSARSAQPQINDGVRVKVPDVLRLSPSAAALFEDGNSISVPSRKNEEICREWGFKDNRTAQMMQQRAKKMKFNAERREKLKKLDPHQRLALFRKLGEVTRLTPIKTQSRAMLPKKEYFQARQFSMGVNFGHLDSMSREEENKMKESRTYQWIHTQITQPELLDSKSNSEKPSVYDYKKLFHPGQRLILFDNRRINSAGNMVVSGTTDQCRSLTGTDSEAGKETRRHSTPGSVKRPLHLPPIDKQSTRTWGASISHWDRNVWNSGGWGCGRKRNKRKRSPNKSDA